MNKKLIFVLAFIVIAGTANAQTRRIAHRSHGGSMHDRYENVDGNYGIPSVKYTIATPLPHPAPVLSAVTWVQDTINGKVIWRLDTLRESSVTPTEQKAYRYVIITDVRELGHVCSKTTTR